MSRRSTIRPVSLALAGLVLAAACAAPGASSSPSAPPASDLPTEAPSASPSPSAPGEPAGLVGTWRLIAIGDDPVPAEPVRTLAIAADGTVEGHGGCNGFGGSAEVGQGSVTFGALMSTKMACADQAQQTLEDRYLAALGTAVAWSVGSGGEIVVEGPDGRLTFLPGA